MDGLDGGSADRSTRIGNGMVGMINATLERLRAIAIGGSANVGQQCHYRDGHVGGHWIQSSSTIADDIEFRHCRAGCFQGIGHDSEVQSRHVDISSGCRHA